MQAFKRTMALVLTLVMVFSVLPVGAFAAEHQAAAELDTGNVTIEGTNGFGNLLSTAISEEQEAATEAESEFRAGYTDTDLKIEGNVATVTYDSAEEAVLVVALYGSAVDYRVFLNESEQVILHGLFAWFWHIQKKLFSFLGHPNVNPRFSCLEFATVSGELRWASTSSQHTRCPSHSKKYEHDHITLFECDSNLAIEKIEETNKIEKLFHGGTLSDSLPENVYIPGSCSAACVGGSEKSFAIYPSLCYNIPAFEGRGNDGTYEKLAKQDFGLFDFPVYSSDPFLSCAPVSGR